MSKMFQIYEEDLVELERMIPDLASALMIHLTPRGKTQLRRLKSILSDVRWNYCPPTACETVGDDPGPAHPGE